MYHIKTIATLTGLSSETLRAWERRYQTVVPARDKSGRRVYSEQDLERLLLLAELTHDGHSIGKLSKLDDGQLLKLAQSESRVTDVSQKQYFDRIIESLQQYRVDSFEELLKRALLAYEPLPYVRDILTPALYRVGQLWHEKKLSVAQEHMFSACVKRIILSMVNNIHLLTHNRPAILFATPQGEVHEFGILMTCLLAASQQFNCYYLGSDLPAAEIVEASRHLHPDVIALSVINSPPEQEIVEQLHWLGETGELRETQIWIGGKGANYLAEHDRLNPRLQLIADIETFYHKAGQFKYLRDRS